MQSPDAIRWFRRAGMAALIVATLLALPPSPTVAQAGPRTFTGPFAGSGTFQNSLCAWRTTYSGTVTLTLTFGATGVTGTARHQGGYQDVLTRGPSECGGDSVTFNESVPVSGTAQNLRWGIGHGAAGSVAVTASLIGNAIVGRGVVTDPEYQGSATIPFTANEVGGSPPASETPPAPTATATSAAPSTPAQATPVRPAAGPTTAAPAAPGTAAAVPAATGTAAGGIAGVATPLPTVPPVPPPKDATTTTFTREKCADFSSDPALWQALENHVDELDDLEVPISAVKTCLGHYRTQPWPQRPGGATLVKPGDEAQKKEAEPPAEAPKPTLQTPAAFILRAGEQGQGTTVQGAVLGKGDIVVTKDQPATVTFSEGSRMDLGAKAAVVFEDPAAKSVIQLRGRMFMDIKSRQWHVRVPQPRGLVAVVTRGTVFATEVLADGNVRVEVTEGVVEVTSAGQTVEVAAGSSIVVDPAAPPPRPARTAGTSGEDGQPVALFGGIAAAAIVVAGAAWFLVRRRGGAAAR